MIGFKGVLNKQTKGEFRLISQVSQDPNYPACIPHQLEVLDVFHHQIALHWEDPLGVQDAGT